MDILGQDIKFLPGVGPNRKKMLSDELGIETYGDLLEYYPYKYVDRSKVYTIHELTGDMPYIQVVGHILSFETFPMGQRKERVVAHFTDGTAICDLIWFNGGKYAKQTYRIGTEYVVFGKPTVFNNRINFTHPDLDDASKVDLSSMGLQPYYNTTEKMKKIGLNSRAIERLTKTLVEKLPPLPETLSDPIINERHLMGRDEAFRTVHYPQNARDLERARVRLKFEELFYVQLNILRYASDHRRKYRGYRPGLQHLLSRAPTLPLDGGTEKGDQGDQGRRWVGQADEPSAAGRRGKREDPRGPDVDAHRHRQRLSGLHHGAHGNPRRTAPADHHAVPRWHGPPRGPADGHRQGQAP